MKLSPAHARDLRKAAELVEADDTCDFKEVLYGFVQCIASRMYGEIYLARQAEEVAATNGKGGQP